jgi:hypothetical protein
MFALFFNRLLQIFHLLILLCVITGCRNDSIENPFSIQSEGPGYRPDRTMLQDNDVHVSVKTKTDLRNGELVVLLNVKNNSGRSIEVDYMNSALNIDEERTAVPKVMLPCRSNIPADDEENYEIYFHPINSIAFNDNTGYRGDMKQQYSFDVNFITDWNGKKLINERVLLALPDTAYQTYLSRQGRQNFMKLFEFDLNHEVFDVSQARHLEKIFHGKTSENVDQAPAIYSLNPSITINRMIFNVFGYTEKDTLIINMRMLNEDRQPLRIIPQKCAVNVSGTRLLPVYHFSDSFDNGHLPDSAYIFKPGTRLHLMLKYYVPHELDSWSLDTDWLLISRNSQHTSWNKLIFTDLKFRESLLSKDL